MASAQEKEKMMEESEASSAKFVGDPKDKREECMTNEHLNYSSITIYWGKGRKPE